MAAVRRTVGLPVGVNALRNDAAAALANGAIVGCTVKRDGRAGSGVDPERARGLVAAHRASH
jgi:predicted TIM-barrel enzyme